MSYVLSDLTLAVARPEQVRQTRLNTFDYWGKSRGFSDEASYLRRDEFMEREAWAKSGRLTTWILVPRSSIDPATGISSATSEDILSHVETYRRPAFAYGPGSTSPESCFAVGIASVYTPERFRMRGYGKRMLQILHYIIAPASALPAFPEAFGRPPVLPPGHLARDSLFSVLYSDVGEAFYRRCTIGEDRPGWIEQGSTGHEWALQSRRDVAPPSGWEWLATADDVKALEGALDAGMQDQVSRGIVGDRSRTRVGFSAAQDLLPLHVHRALLSPPFPDSQPPRVSTSFGLTSSSTSSALFYYPSHEPPPYKGTWPSPADKTLLITATLGNVPWSVVEAAAAREGCTRVEIWGEEPLAKDWPAGRAFTRDEHLSQLAWYGPAEADPPQLVFNQKYAWC